MNRVNVLELTYDEARKFFLKQESYCNIDLPKYFSFSELLDKISHEFTEPKRLTDFSMSKGAIGELDDVNHLIYANKDGKLSWRPLQLIHPLVYVDLVHEITKKDNWGKLQARFKKFQKNKKIKCLSIPVQSESRQSDKAQQILKWWELVEQESIFLSLEYDYVFDTDVADCYGSIYTHSIAWAVESKQVAKQDRSGNRLGNFIDKSIQNAQYQQTNGIPQGSVLMDFIAEIVLGYIDRMLSAVLQKQKIIKYQILRYRDDYRIFVCNANDGEKILKLLSEIMMPLGLKLNASKTKGSQDVITQSIKKDKLSSLFNIFNFFLYFISKYPFFFTQLNELNNLFLFTRTYFHSIKNTAFTIISFGIFLYFKYAISLSIVIKFSFFALYQNKNKFILNYFLKNSIKSSSK